MVLEIFKIVLRLRNRHVFMRQSVEILKVLSILTLRLIFWKMETFFKILEHNFSVENSKMENASFPYSTAISEANVKKMVTTKRIFHKERVFASNYFICF